MTQGRLYLIDAMAFCYRAFYAVGGLSTSFGQPTNAIYGFVNMLQKIIKERAPEYLVACFDVSRDTLRQKKFTQYKMQRPPMPEGLSAQIPLIRQLLSAYGIAVFEKKGYEADDIIATLAARVKEEGFKVTIFSSDKDIMQLVDEDTEVFNPYKDTGVTYDEKKVKERFGVSPCRIADMIALMGDAADNIPGVPGIGEKTAAGLIEEFGSLDELLAHPDKIASLKVRAAVKDNIDTVKLNKELAVLDKGVKLDFKTKDLKISKPDTRELFRLFKQLEFKKFLKELSGTQEEVPQEPSVPVTELKDSDLGALLAKAGEVTLALQAGGKIFLSAAGKNFAPNKIGSSVKDILARGDIRKTGHDLKNTKVDLAKLGIRLEGLYFDTMIAGHLLNPAKGSYALEELAWDYLGQVPLNSGIDSAKAPELIAKLKPVLESELSKKSLLELFYSIEMPLAGVLAEMELTGIKLDLGLLSNLSKEIEHKLIRLIEDIYRISGTEFNINSPKQLRTILFEKLELRIVKKTKTGPSTDEEVLRVLSASHELPALLLEYRQLTKLKNTYVDTLPALVDSKTGMLHTSFNQAATETGRLSSSNPNLQNIPVKTEIGSRIRQAIVAFNKESCLLACDYSQIELRILAHISGDENLIAEFKEDKDIHRATAALIYGICEDEVTDQMRDSSKRVNFGIIYGLTSYGLSRDLGIPLDKAQDFIDAYLAKYPRVKDYMQEQIEKAQEEGFVTTIAGRRRYLPEIKDKNLGVRQFAQRKAINTPIQGSASDLIKMAMIAIQRLIEEKNLKTKMILQVHDELVFNVPLAELKTAQGLIRERMEQVLTLRVPVKVSIKKGNNWLDMESFN